MDQPRRSIGKSSPEHELAVERQVRVPVVGRATSLYGHGTRGGPETNDVPIGPIVLLVDELDTVPRRLALFSRSRSETHETSAV
jgi:hypothetical protein